jgi:hypothetical protein
MDMRIQIPKCILVVLNQLYELEQKLKRQDDPGSLSRNIGKMKDAFAEEGLPGGDHVRIRLVYEDPMGQPFKETRTDLDATIAGSVTEDLVVVEVIKPIIRAIVRDGVSQIVQKGVVIVESRKRQ